MMLVFGSKHWRFSQKLRSHRAASKTYLVEVDDGFPELVLELVEVTHTDLTAVKGVRHLRVRKTRRIGANLQVTGMVLVHVGSVVVLTTGKTTTTGMLAVLTDTTVTGRDITTLLTICLFTSGL